MRFGSPAFNIGRRRIRSPEFGGGTSFERGAALDLRFDRLAFLMAGGATPLSELDGYHSRSSTAWCKEGGVWKLTPSGAMRMVAGAGYQSEESTTGLIDPQSSGPWSPAVTAQSHALSFEGTGTIMLSGAFTGSLVGTGANNRVSMVFTPAAGTLTLTPSGSVTMPHLEAKAYATTPINGFRQADVLAMTLAQAGMGAATGAVFWRGAVLTDAPFGYTLRLDDGTEANRIGIAWIGTGTGMRAVVTSAGVQQALLAATPSQTPLGSDVTVGVTWGGGVPPRMKVGSLSPANGTASAPPSLTSVRLSGVGGLPANAIHRRVTGFASRLDDATFDATFARIAA